jgi:hypothetical protein
MTNNTCAPTMRTDQDAASCRAAGRSVRLRLFLIPILTLAFYFSPTLLHAQIDLCSLSDGIVLEAGVNHSVLVKVPAGTVIKMTLERECDPERDETSYNGLYLYGTNYYQYEEWTTGPKNNPSAMPLVKTFLQTPLDAEEILIELDACEGTRVRVECA